MEQDTPAPRSRPHRSTFLFTDSPLGFGCPWEQQQYAFSGNNFSLSGQVTKGRIYYSGIHFMTFADKVNSSKTDILPYKFRHSVLVLNKWLKIYSGILLIIREHLWFLLSCWFCQIFLYEIVLPTISYYKKS